MKKILVPLMLLSASSAFAQKWSVGVNAGALWNTKPLKTTFAYDDPIVERKSSEISKAITLGVNYSLTSNWQVGLAFDYQELNYRYTAYDESWKNVSVHGTEHFDTWSIVGKVNRLFSVNRFQYYGGINAGAVPVDWEWTLRAGIQAGANFAISRHVIANGELSGNYFNGSSKSYNVLPPFISTSCTVGIHYYF